MAESEEHPGPDLRPWDPENVQRFQPVISALFHDMMTPLSLVKTRLYLLRKQVQALETGAMLPEDVRQRAAAIRHLLDGLDDAANRIHKGLTVPRDAVWEALLEGKPFMPEDVITRIGEALQTPKNPELVQPQA